MTERQPFSIEQSEELIAQLKTEMSTEFEQLRKTLKLLGQVPELSQGMVPPALPSTVNQSVVSIARKSSQSHRTVMTSIIAAGILVSATLTAAAVTGRGPAPIVAAAHSTAKFVKEVVGTVTSVITGNTFSAPTDTTDVTPQPVVPSVAPTPSSEVSNDNSESTQIPIVIAPENPPKEKTHSDETKTGKEPSSSPLPTNIENGTEGENSPKNKPSETPAPETTPAPEPTPAPEVTGGVGATAEAGGGVVPDQDRATPAPQISHPEVKPEP